MPLRLLNFSASSSGIANNLYWNTANESSMQLFEIEKSIDGIKFNSIGKVKAVNASNNSYSFSDNSSKATAYYRLKMINKDGSYTYSFIVLVKRSTNDVLTIYPNPAKDVITISHAAAQANQRIDLLSIEGKTIQSLQVIAGSTQTSFNIDFLQPGLYLLKYSNGKEYQTIKLKKN